MTARIDILLKKKSKMLDRLMKNSDFAKGSLIKVQRRGKEGNSYHLTYKDENQKTRTKYISEHERHKAEKAIRSMKKVNALINEISKINIELLKMEE
jgi:hypothetical protein